MSLSNLINECLDHGVKNYSFLKALDPFTGRGYDGKEPVLIGDRIMLVEPIKAARIHARKLELAEKSKRIDRELREARIIRDGVGSQLAGWISPKPTFVKW